MIVCNEKLFDDIVDIRIFSASDVVSTLPPTVPGLTSLGIVSLGQPLALVSIREDNDVDMVMDTLPTVKVTTVRANMTTSYTHEISITVDYGYEKVPELVEKAKNQDVYLIYRTTGNEYLLSYAYPETSMLTHEDSAGNNRTAQIKVQMKSLSGLIRLAVPA